MRFIVLVGALAGCVDMPGPGDPVIGTSADVRTQPGTYVGYRVVAPCQGPGVQIGVVGTGSTKLTKVDDIAAAGATLLSQFKDLPSVWGGGGYGLVCDPGVGSEIELDSWRDVDTVIARTGQWLNDQNLALELAISVGSVPVADSGS